MRPRAGCNGNSERFRSFHRSGAPTGGARGLFHPCGAHGQKAKNSGQGRPTATPWVENNRFPRPPGQRRMGVLPKYSTYLILPGIIPAGINHTIKCQPIGLYLPHGYRNIITCTGRDLAWAGVLRVQLPRRGDRVGHQLTFIPHHIDVVVSLSLHYEKTIKQSNAPTNVWHR